MMLKQKSHLQNKKGFHTKCKGMDILFLKRILRKEINKKKIPSMNYEKYSVSKTSADFLCPKGTLGWP